MVRIDIKMGRGKIAAQVGHAVLDSYKDACKLRNQTVKAWEDIGCAKIVLQVNSESELIKIIENAKSKGLPTSLIADAGRTEVTPGTITVGAIGPGTNTEIDVFTGHLKLLS